MKDKRIDILETELSELREEVRRLREVVSEYVAPTNTREDIRRVVQSGNALEFIKAQNKRREGLK